MNNRTILVLTVVDLSGSMRGQSASLAQVQLQELLAQMQNAEQRSGNRVIVGIIGFNTTAFWLMEPVEAGALNDPPRLTVKPNADGFYPRTSYTVMLGAVHKNLCELMSGSRFGTIDDAHIILISDGYSTDTEEDLKREMDQFQNSRGYDKDRCQFYLVGDDLDIDQPIEYRKWFVQAFVGAEFNWVKTSDSAGLFARIFGSILDGGSGPVGVF